MPTVPSHNSQLLHIWFSSAGWGTLVGMRIFTGTGQFRAAPFAMVKEVQTVEVTAATDGTFTLTFDGQETAAIDFDATDAAVEAALEALSNLAPGDVAVTGGPLSTAPVEVEFDGTLEGVNVPVMTADGAELVGEDAAVTIATDTAGSGADVTVYTLSGKKLKLDDVTTERLLSTTGKVTTKAALV